MTALVELYGLEHDALVRWIAKVYGINSADGTTQYRNQHRLRREVIARRLRLYRDQACVDVEWTIDQIYETREYQLTLKRYVPLALEQNVTRRIIDEIASLYDQPAFRVFSDDATTARYRIEETRLHLHEIMQEENRLGTLCNETLLWLFQGVNGTRLQLITPDMFDAIPDPRDRLVPAGYLLDALPVTAAQGDDLKRLPHYELWDDTYRYLLNAYGQMVDAKGQTTAEPQPHNLGRIPGVLYHRREPTTCILDSSHGADIESAHLGVALLNVMIMRLSKSQGENQPILQGNLAALTAGQVMNGERPLMLPPEVIASVLNTKTDATHYLEVKRDKIANVAQTYGMSYEQFSRSGTDDSGRLYEMRREKLKEIRNESRRRAVVNERAIADLLGFPGDSLRIDFQEQSLPQDAQEERALLQTDMKLGLDSPVSYIQRKDPDKSREEAIAEMQSNLRDYAVLIEWVRALNAPADANAFNPGQTPQQNGAMSQQGQPPTQPTDAPPEDAAA